MTAKADDPTFLVAMLNARWSAEAAGGHLGKRGLLCVAHLPLDLKMVSELTPFTGGLFCGGRL